MSNASERVIHTERAVLLARWHSLALGLFSEKMASGTPIYEGLHDAMLLILDGLEEPGESCREGIEGLARIFAIHPFPPSAFMKLFFELQVLLSELFTDEAEQKALQARMEDLILEAFDAFMLHREKIYRLKVEESSRSMYMALRRVGR